LTEFDLIARYFTRPFAADGLVACGIGDDCALLDSGENMLAVTTDLLVEGRHFAPSVDAASLGHKALAVNLSDLAAAGASPRCFFLALALPRADSAWLAGFSHGMFALADAHGCVLAGGDTTRSPAASPGDGPICVCITAIGEVPRSMIRTRAGARVGDDIWVSDRLGGAALALAHRNGVTDELTPIEAGACATRLNRPEPRIPLGVALRGIATACIDVSDGLLGDLGHILSRSQCGARIHWKDLPRQPGLSAQPADLHARCLLAGGDDYELLFTAAADRRERVQAAATAAGVPVTRIGAITDGRDLVVLDGQGLPMDTPFKAYDHFG